MPCQLMVGFFAYAKSLDIKVDKAELEGILTNVHIICITMSPLLVFFLRQLLLKFSFTLNGSELVETLCTDAQWHTREDVKKALTLSDYEKTQRSAAAKVEQLCNGVESRHSQSADINAEDSGLASMFFPGPYAIAHQLISSWAYQDNGK